MPTTFPANGSARFRRGRDEETVDEVVVVVVTRADTATVLTVAMRAGAGASCELPHPAIAIPAATSGATSRAERNIPEHATRSLRMPDSPPMRGDRLLELIGDVIELVEIEDFRVGVLQAVHRAVRADWVGLSEVGADPDSVFEIVEPTLSAQTFRAFAELAHQNPLVQRLDRTRDGRAYRFSDLVTPEELHALEIFDRVYKPIGLEHQIAFTLESHRDRILAIHLSRRRRRRDFSDEDRDLLNAARPFMIQAYRNALRYSARLEPVPAPPPLDSLMPLGLTRRQAEVLQHLASGASEQAIAARLGLSVRTVQKHLELIYRRLGVNNRSQAAAIAWSGTG
jgi:DNA-binding CsgD family transcriptional regulator